MVEAVHAIGATRTASTAVANPASASRAEEFSARDSFGAPVEPRPTTTRQGRRAQRARSHPGQERGKSARQLDIPCDRRGHRQRKQPSLPAAAPVEAPQDHEPATGERRNRRCHGDHVEGMRDPTGGECDRVDCKPQRPHQESSADQVGTRRAAALPHANDKADQRQRVQPADLRRDRVTDHERPCAMGVRPTETNRRIAAHAVAAEQVVLEHHRKW